MEILATNVSHIGAIFITIFFGLLALLTLAVANDKTVAKWERYTATICGVFCLLVVMGIWYTGGDVVTYDAIVTDWNEVYEQGYEVVETNGKIVTLRKGER